VSEAEPPLTVFHPWSIELTSPSLLPIAGLPPATVAPPHQKNAAAEPVFSPSLLMRSSGELSPPPPCPAGSLTVVGARPPLFVPPPPLWRRRWPRPGAVTAPACVALRRAIAGRTGRGRPGKRGPRAMHTGHTPRGHGPRTHCARGPRATVQLSRAPIQPSSTQIDFSIFRLCSNSCKFKNYETNFVGKVLIYTRL
jgi:hypothetical protein